MKVLSTCLLSLLYSFLSAQGDFTITGKIERSLKSNFIILGSSYGTFTETIKKDGSFLITGKGIKTAGDALIYTDSSGANSIWLEPGEYHLECREEITAFSSRPIFRITKLYGPKDAEINHVFQERFIDINNSLPREQKREAARSFAIRYIDSVFKYFPSSKVLPKFIKFSISSIGDEAAKVYYSLLSNEQISQPGGGEQLANYFKRKEKIEKETYFQDFKMKDQNGRDFKLSSINRKLILLDFWASWCAPCRRKHPKLVELYKKYSEKGFEIISISLDDKKSNWKNAILKDNIIWINISELKGWNTSLAKKYFVSGIPFSIWLDKDKKIISTTDLSESQIEEYLK